MRREDDRNRNMNAGPTNSSNDNERRILNTYERNVGQNWRQDKTGQSLTEGDRLNHEHIMRERRIMKKKCNSSKPLLVI